ncbi:hypothetical protein ABZX92_38180 [Lentzea sp. NPDC006480]|uniref:hypothetical protein n=1 Tax=Lentzea sp. NPDC006480 TaxID=3157176 RepID=UPI0033B95112
MRVLAMAAAVLVALSTLVAPAQAAATPVYRYEIINRAASWLTAYNGGRVPYDIYGRQDGYRTDCSGYVSMAAKLDKPGPITQDLPGLSTLISMAELKRGDIVIDAIGDTWRDRHVVIFDRWVDPARRDFGYYAYEQRGDYGTDHRVRGYGLEPYTEYRARRLNNVIDK